MAIYEAGREASLLEDVKSGAKTVEARLNRDQYRNYKPGDIVHVRADTWKDGQLVSSLPNQVTIEVIKVVSYQTIKELMEEVGYTKVIPRAQSLDDALSQIRQFYSEEDEKKHGALAVYFKLL